MKAVKTLLAAIPMLLLAQTANAAIYQIQVSGVNLNYTQSTGTICDSGGGTGCFATEDPLNTMTFLVDNVVQGTYTTNIGINALLQLPAGTSPFVNATTNLTGDSGQIFDFEINSSPGLFTNVTSGSVTFSNTSVNATGTGFSTVFAQSLPFGFVATNPINWSFSAGLGSCTNGVCSYAGTGELSWVANAPEPAMLLLFGTALIGAARRRRRA